MEAFSVQTYSDLLRELQKSGRSWDSFSRPTDKGMLLRHDVDYCLGAAEKIAHKNNVLSIQATFFILVSSPLYNIFSRKSHRALKNILDSNQHVGLHYHHTGGPLDTERLEREFAGLRLVLPETQRIVAWHNPEGDLELLNQGARDAGFIPTYDPAFFGPGRYISDSNMHKSPQSILEFVAGNNEKLTQILLHPIIWCSETGSMLNTLQTEYARQARELEATFEENGLYKQYKQRSRRHQ